MRGEVGVKWNWAPNRVGCKARLSGTEPELEAWKDPRHDGSRRRESKAKQSARGSGHQLDLVSLWAGLGWGRVFFFLLLFYNLGSVSARERAKQLRRQSLCSRWSSSGRRNATSVERDHRSVGVTKVKGWDGKHNPVNDDLEEQNDKKKKGEAVSGNESIWQRGQRARGRG